MVLLAQGPEVAEFVIEDIVEETMRHPRVGSVTVRIDSGYPVQAGFDFAAVSFTGTGKGPVHLHYQIVRTEYQVKRQGNITGLLSREEEIRLLGSAYGLVAEFKKASGFEIARLRHRDSAFPVAYLNQHGFWIMPPAKNFRTSMESTKWDGLRLVKALEAYFGMPAAPSLDTLDTRLVPDFNFLFWYDAHLDDKSRFQIPSLYRNALGLDVILEYVTIQERPVLRLVESSHFREEVLGAPVQDTGEVLYQRQIELAQRAALGKMDPQGRLVLDRRHRQMLGMMPGENELLLIGSGDPHYLFVTLRSYFPDIKPRAPQVQLPLL